MASKKIKKQGAQSIDDIFIAQVDSNGSLYVDLYKDKIQKDES